jgi:hypothetical protein
MEKQPGIESTTRVPRKSYSRETVQPVLETWGRMCNALPLSAQDMRKWEREI